MSGAGAGVEVRICVGLGSWDFGKTDPLGRDYCRPAFLQRCVCNENQCYQHRTDCHKIGEDWHRLTPTARRHAPRLSPSDRQLVELDHGVADLYICICMRRLSP